MFFEFETKRKEMVSVKLDKIAFVVKSKDGSCFLYDTSENIYSCMESYDEITERLNKCQLSLKK